MLKARVTNIYEVLPEYLKDGTAEREADEDKLAAAVAAGMRAAPGLAVEEVPDEAPPTKRRGSAGITEVGP